MGELCDSDDDDDDDDGAPSTVAEDDETLCAVLRGQKIVFADGTLPNQNELLYFV